MEAVEQKRKKSLKVSMLVFISLWLVYYLLELVSGRLTDIYSILINLFIPVLFLLVTAAVFHYFSIKREKGFSFGRILFTIGMLVIIEQLIKYIIRNNFPAGTSYELIHSWLYFEPTLNTKGSWGASRFGLNFGMQVFIIFNIIVIPLVLQIYRFYIKNEESSYWIDTCFILCFSGIICSLIDKLFFGGSLDYLMLDGLFVADLKDFYITLSIGCLFVEMLENPKSNSSTKEDLDLIKKFIRFNRDELVRLKDRIF